MEPRRLLVVRPDRVGDVVISSSCLPPLRGRFPEAELFFAARPVMAPLFASHPFARFLSLPDPKLPFLRRVALFRRALEEAGIDCVVFLHPDRACYLAAWRAGIPRRTGYPERWTGWSLTEQVPERRPEHRLHEAAYNFDLLRSLDLAAPETFRASIELPEAARSSLERKTAGRLAHRDFVCLHLGAFSPVARWPVSHFIELAQRLHRQHGLQIVLVGHDHEDTAHRAFRDAAGDLPYVDFAGELDLAELGWLLRRARCLISRDTGPAHLAAAVGCPTVALFCRIVPPHGPTRWMPLGEPSLVRGVSTPVHSRLPGENRDTFWRRSCAAIPVTAVVTAVEELLFPEKHFP